MSATAKSVRRCRYSRTDPGISASVTEAAITTAARVGWGRSANSPGRAMSISAMTRAPTRPVTWDLDPALSATAVRELLVLTGNPWNRPAPMFDTPIAIISRLPSTRCP